MHRHPSTDSEHSTDADLAETYVGIPRGVVATSQHLPFLAQTEEEAEGTMTGISYGPQCSVGQTVWPPFIPSGGSDR